MPALVLIIGSIFIKAFAMWFKLQESTSNEEDDNIDDSDDKIDSKIKETTKQIKFDDFEVGNIASELLWSHIFGVGIMMSPKLFTIIGNQFLQLQTQDCIYFGFAITTLLTFMWFFFVKRLLIIIEEKNNF